MVGKQAPTFSLQDQDGKTHTLSDYQGKYVVLYTYPKDDTPGCTKQACGFRDRVAEFTQHGVVVLGLSILDTASKAKFAKKHHLNFPLLADEGHAVAERYGVWKEKSMYGKTYLGVSRETFVIGPDQTIVMHWPKAAGSEDHSQEVLDWLREQAG